MLLNNQIFCPEQHKTKWWQCWLLATSNVMMQHGSLRAMNWSWVFSNGYIPLKNGKGSLPHIVTQWCENSSVSWLFILRPFPPLSLHSIYLFTFSLYDRLHFYTHLYFQLRPAKNFRESTLKLECQWRLCSVWKRRQNLPYIFRKRET